MFRLLLCICFSVGGHYDVSYQKGLYKLLNDFYNKKISYDNVSIYVIDYIGVLYKSKAFVEFDSKLVKAKDIYQKEITKKEQELREVEVHIRNSENVLNDKIYANRKRSFDDKLRSIRQEIAEKRKHYMKCTNHVVQILRKKIDDIIRRCIIEPAVVLDKTTMLFSSAGIDLSYRIQKILDEEIVSIDINI